MLREELPTGLPVVFISAVAQQGLEELKDTLWRELSKETLHEPDSIVRQALDLTSLTWDDEDDLFPTPMEDEEEEEALDDIDFDLEIEYDDEGDDTPDQL